MQSRFALHVGLARSAFSLTRELLTNLVVFPVTGCASQLDLREAIHMAILDSEVGGRVAILFEDAGYVQNHPDPRPRTTNQPLSDASTGTPTRTASK